MVYKIGLCGTASSGKTTLFEAVKRNLHDYNGIEYLAEIARDVPAGNRQTIYAQDYIMRKQVEAEFALRWDTKVLLTDRTVWDNIAYCLWYMGGENYVVAQEIIDRFYEYCCNYDVIFFIDDFMDIPYEDDGDREMDTNKRNSVHWILKTLLRKRNSVFV